ncbi:hypothetical protein BA895_02030 [Humibacillus sp. DSM 29435]|nr:hypothetical protein BA895_02030 [Humibacillus sp. DSM 29435]
MAVRENRPEKRATMRSTARHATRDTISAGRAATLSTLLCAGVMALTGCTANAPSAPTGPVVTSSATGASPTGAAVPSTGAVSAGSASSSAVPTTPTSAAQAPTTSPSAQPSAVTPAKVDCQRTLPSYPLLRPGDEGAPVAALQCLLNDAKLGPVIVDGSYGPQTRAAILNVARGTEGVVDTSGRVDRVVWVTIISRALSGRTLRAGSRGADVVTLQRALRSQGCTISVDGSFGRQTAAVVKRFQRATGNVPDGIVGEATRFALQSGGATGWHCP